MPIKILKSLLAILMLCCALLAIALILIDPDDYRAQIEAKALDTAGLNIEINGDLSWSFIPLGFELKELSILDSEQALFTKVSSVNLAVDTVSLLKLSPIVTSIYADGAKVSLKVHQDGSTNWSRLLSSQMANSNTHSGTLHASSKDTFRFAKTSVSLSSETGSSIRSNDSKPIVIIPARHVHISNIDITYIDEANQQDAEISDLSIELRDVDIDKTFPVAISFGLSSKIQNLVYRHSLSADIHASNDLSNFRISNLVNNIDASGDFSNNRALKLSLTADLEYSVSDAHLSAENVQLSGAGLAVDTSFNLDHSGAALDVMGNINVAPFSLSSVDTHLGLNLGVNNAAFRNVTLETPFTLSKNRFRLPTFDLRIDESQFIGQLMLNVPSNAIELTLKGDSIVLDKYVAALDVTPELLVQVDNTKSGSVLAAISSPDPATLTNHATKALLPLHLLADLAARVDFSQDKIHYQNYHISNAGLSFEVLDGKLNVEKATAQIFGGLIKSIASIDLTDVPKWSIETSMHNLDVAEIIASQPSLNLPIAALGRLNLVADLNARGNTVNTLLHENNGGLYLEVLGGMLSDINFDEYLCKGFSSITKKTRASEQWGGNTNFETLSAQNSIANGHLTTEALTLESGTIHALGSGKLDINNQDFEYTVGVKPRRNAISPACLVSPKFAELQIPIACHGALNGVNPVSCEINEKELATITESIARAEASRKIEKEVDRAIEKKLDKYLEKDSEIAKQFKESLMGLLK